MVIKVKPNFFILGAPKCGTTSLANWLGAHPDIYVSPIKEPNYFNTDVKIVNRMTAGEYEALWNGVRECHTCVGEASTAYLRSSSATENILAYAPSAKFVVCVRNPVEMAVSLHGERLKEGLETEADFGKAWALQQKRANGVGVPLGCVEASDLLYGEACKVGTQLRKLVDRVGRDRVHIICLDDMRACPEAVYAKLLLFLGVCNFQPDFAVVNEAIRVPQVLSRAIRLYLIAKRKMGIRRGLGLMTPIFRFIGSKRSVRVAPSLMETELRPYFRQEISIVEDILARSLDHWRG